MTYAISRDLRVRRGVPIVATGARNPGISGRTAHGRLNRRGRRPRLRVGQCHRCLPRLAEHRRPRCSRAGDAQCARGIRDARRSPPGSACGHLALGRRPGRSAHRPGRADDRSKPSPDPNDSHSYDDHSADASDSAHVRRRHRRPRHGGHRGRHVSGTGAGVGTIVKKVTGPAGGPVSSVGAGDTITKVTSGAGERHLQDRLGERFDAWRGHR